MGSFPLSFFIAVVPFVAHGFNVQYHGLFARQITHLGARRYGPPLDDVPAPPSAKKDHPQQRLRTVATLRTLVEQVMQAQDPNHIPSILTQANLHVMLALDSSEEGADIVRELLEQVPPEHKEAYETALGTILDFTEQFVTVAEQMDRHNKELLGKILRVMSPATAEGTTTTSLEREERFNALLVQEREQLTAGFLRHLEGECQRIASAPTMTPESTRLIGLLRLIQTRVLEELGQDLGEAAQVLSQLISYESDTERIAVLEAGLLVQGPAYALELLDLTGEALRGFRRAGADADLVQRVRRIDTHLREHLNVPAKGETLTP